MIAEIIGSFGVGRQLNDLSSDSGPESIGWRKWAGRKKVQEGGEGGGA